MYVYMPLLVERGICLLLLVEEINHGNAIQYLYKLIVIVHY